MLIDSHAHVNFIEYNDDLEDVIKRSLDSDTQIINVGSNYETSQKVIEIAEQYKTGVWAAVGCHPIHLIKDIEEKAVFDKKEYVYKTPQEKFNYDEYLKLAKSSDKVVGIGETGLDFYRIADQDNSIEQIKELQIKVFQEHIDLAKELDLPLSIHCRGEEKAPYEVYDLMIDNLNSDIGGVIHCYGGNLEQAKKLVDMGFYIGITGIVTFKNAKELQKVVKEIPLEKLLIETDAPFLAPDPNRGKRNEPSYVKYVAMKIAELKEISYEKVEKQTYENTVNLFNLTK